MSEEVYLLISIFLFCLVTFSIAWRLAFFTFPVPRYPETSKLHFLHVFLIFLTFFISVIIAFPLSFLFLSLAIPGASPSDVQIQGWMNVIAISLVALIMFLALLLFGQRVRSAALGPAFTINFTRTLHDIGLGALTWLICYPIVSLVNTLVKLLLSYGFTFPHNDQIAVKQMMGLLNYPLLFTLMGLIIITAVPFAEELLFRGFLYTWLKQKIGFFRAMALSAFIFALFHFSISQGINNIELLMSLFLLGCFLAFVYERQQSLWTPIALHATFNGISILAIALA